MASSSQAEASKKKTLNWLELPRDLTSSILSKLGAIEILNSAQYVCTGWRNICKDPAMWRSIDMRNDGSVKGVDKKVLCCNAVDRSCGGLKYINIEHFGTDSVMNYIADRSSSLTHLRLLSCNSISNNGLIKAIAKLPMLEEVEILYFKISRDVLEAIGRSCPLLKTFKYYMFGYNQLGLESNVEALAIARTMRELCHLHLLGSKLTNSSLSSILDGCPNLESLDLRGCLRVNLVGDLEKRCLDRIKVLRRPYDPLDAFDKDSLDAYDIKMMILDWNHYDMIAILKAIRGEMARFTRY